MNSAYTINPKEFDKSVKPTNDFFSYINNTWISDNPIPADEARWGTFTILNYQVEQQLKALMDGLATRKDLLPDSSLKKIQDFWLTAMDTEKLNKLGLSPLTPLYEVIDGLTGSADAPRVIALLHRSGVGAWWRSVVSQDEKQSEMMILNLAQGGLGLPDRDYYTKEDEKSREIRRKYVSFVADFLELSGIDKEESAGCAYRIMDIETQLADASMTRTELRDIEKQYNKRSLVELAALTPLIDWSLYFETINAKPKTTIVCQPEFFVTVNRLFEELSLDDMKTYLKWQTLNTFGRYLNEDLEQAKFNFYDKTFGGATKMKPRWRRVLGITSDMLDELVGQLYVERHFSQEAKEKINSLVSHLIEAYGQRIKNLNWMSDDTKQKALAKLGKITRKLGYPDVWKDFSTLTVGVDSYAQNYMRAHAFEFDRKIAQIGQPVDRSEWHMPPQMVNAYYSQSMNEIAFPAGILQPPFFDPNADDAVNFGGIGGVISHELTHGFDDQGALFDPNGNMQNWWTDEDKKRFDEKTAQYAQQFDQYEVLPGLHINGQLTLGENIADLGGIAIAYNGLQLALANAKQSEIDGLTPQQRFFVSWAIVWRNHAREEFLRARINDDPHSPSYYRVNGPLSNTPAFYEAFGCKKGDKLWRDDNDRVKVW